MVKDSPTISASANSPVMKSGPAGLLISELRHCATRLWEFCLFMVQALEYSGRVNLLFCLSEMFLNVEAACAVVREHGLLDGWEIFAACDAPFTPATDLVFR
jgi:hypothetical protein